MLGNEVAQKKVTQKKKVKIVLPSKRKSLPAASSTIDSQTIKTSNLDHPKDCHSPQSTSSKEDVSRSDEDDIFETPEVTARSVRARSTLPIETTTIKPPAKKRVKKEIPKYSPHPDELPESQEFEVIGEDLVEENDLNIVPVRDLDNYVFYNSNKDNIMISIDKIQDFEYISVSGIVRCQQEDDDDDNVDEEDDEDNNDNVQRIKLSAIFNIDVESYESGFPAIFVQTQFAYYRLINPNPIFAPLVRDYLASIKMQSTIICALIQTPSISYPDFIESMNSSIDFFGAGESSSSLSAQPTKKISAVTGTRYSFLLQEKDLLTNAAALYDNVCDWLEGQEFFSAMFSPLIMEIFQKCNMKKSKKGTSAKEFRAHYDKSDTNLSVLKKRNLSTVTPLILSVSMGLFRNKVVQTKRLEDTVKIVAEKVPQKDGADVVEMQEDDAVEEEETDDDDMVGVESEVLAKKIDCKHPSPIFPVDKQKEIKTEKLAAIIKKETKLAKFIGSPFASVKTKSYYEEAVVEDKTIHSGDCVFVRNESNEPWIGKICYLFKDTAHPSSEFFAHVRFLIPGKDTILAETADFHELFLVNECEDIDLYSIAGVCDVKYIKSGEFHPEIAKDFEQNQFYYRYWYDSSNALMENALKHELMTPEIPSGVSIQYCREHEWCTSCETRIGLKQMEVPRLVPDDPSMLMFNGQSYKIGEFVYLLPKIEHFPNGNPCPYAIGQLLEITDDKKSSDGSKLTISVRLFCRYNDALAERDILRRVFLEKSGNREDILLVPNLGGEKRDDRQLYLTERTISISATQLEGVCWVQYFSPENIIEDISVLEKYKELEDSFWIGKGKGWFSGKWSDKVMDEINEFDCEDIDDLSKLDKKIEGYFPLKHIQPEDIVPNEQRLETREKSLADTDLFLGETKKLVALDIFSGCGGLTVGMESTGVVETKHAVEFSSSAAKTFQNNFPGAIVHNQCASVLLDRAIRIHDHKEKNIEPINDYMEQQLVDLPAPGAIDFIYCGPPCQGYSGINRFKKADDIKNTLVATSLSYVDFYRPKYFLLENVRGMITYKLGGTQNGNKVEGGIKMGVIKFIWKSLIMMDYQVHFCIQQAGNHGLPQSRRRIFIWGVQRDLTVPKFPQPSHCFGKKGSLTIALPNKITYNPLIRRGGHAPLPPVTVWDAISDLPGFDFLNPHDIYPKEKKSEEEDLLMIGAERYPELALPPLGYGGKMRQAYTIEPRSEFQRIRRRGATELVNHVTRGFNSITVERIANVEMKPFSDHHSLPELLKPWCLSHKDSAAGRHGGWKGLFGRLDYNRFFMTMLTDIQPMGKQGTVIHPTQKRVITTRECARAQGFPDTFVFTSYNSRQKDAVNVKDMIRQVGNAVPPPLAEALGKELAKAMQKDFAKVLKGKGKVRIQAKKPVQQKVFTIPNPISSKSFYN